MTARRARSTLAVALLALVARLPAQTEQLPLPGEVFAVGEYTAFVIEPDASKRRPKKMPWVWYAPTLPRLPGRAERWMFERFLAAGIAIAGIDVGESYGSPKGRAGYEALYDELTGKRGYGPKPVLLARSRGGLMLYSWAVEHPEAVGAVAGIYPVCDLASYPGLSRAAPAFGVTAEELAKRLAEHNPIERLAPLARAKVPVLHIHGDADKTVPLGPNSAELCKRYTALGGDAVVLVEAGRGHDMWRGWFESRALTDFVIDHALGRKQKNRDTMKRTRVLVASAVLVAPAVAQDKMPRRDVIDVPAIGDGLCVHNLFQSDMVLQRNKPIRVWGWAAPDERVVVSFAGKTRKATAKQDRSWTVTFAPLAASSRPREMTVTGERKTLTLDNVLIGDVWLLGGQSNMEFPLSRVDNGALEIVSARFEGLRILTVPAQNGPETKKSFPRLHEWSGWFSRHFRKGDWDVCSPRIARELSAIGYVFARRVHMATRIPIGVIDVSRGGTTVETWTPDSVLRKIDTPEVAGLLADWDERVAKWDARKDLEERVRRHAARVRNKEKRGEKIPAGWKVPTDLRPGPAVDQNRPGNCFASMVAPIAGLAVKGAIFHQGFNNALGDGSLGAARYYQIFGRMITAWRSAFGDAEMPFGIISLCTAGKPQSMDDYVERMLDDGIYIREAQYETFLDFCRAGDENIGFASSFDKRRSWYHPQLKIPVGERISRWALATQYGLAGKIRWKPPTCTKMIVEDGRIVLHMDRVVSAADSGAPIVGFAIAGEDRRFQPAKAEWLVTGRDRNNRPRQDRKALVLSSPHVPEPIHFRYAWGRNPLGNLQSADHNDLPFATQRSDDWKMEEVPLGVLGSETVTGGKLSRAQRRKIQTALRNEDLNRRLAEAKTLLDAHRGRKQRGQQK